MAKRPVIVEPEIQAVNISLAQVKILCGVTAHMVTYPVRQAVALKHQIQ